jgi:DNA invertase Pin-like site-specific DNA recombinase
VQKKNRVAIYVRVSTNDQSCELQIQEIHKFLNAKDWQVTKVYEDQATGTNTNRPQLQQMLSDAAKDKFDVIVSWKLDCLFKSLKDLINTLQTLNELDVDFVSVKDNLDLSTSTGRLMAHIIGAFAEFEAAIIKERVIAGLNAAKANGKKLGRPRSRPSDLIRALYNSGHTYAQIAELASVSTQTAHAEIKEMKRLEKGISK